MVPSTVLYLSPGPQAPPPPTPSTEGADPRPRGPRRLKDLLRRRLRIVVAITAMGFCMNIGLGLLGGVELELLSHGAVLVILLLLATALSVTNDHSLRMLRGIEFTMFGVVTGFFCATQFGYLVGGTDNWEGVAYSGYVSLRWFAMILIYGVLIPNTGRRNAFVVVVMATLPVLISVGAALLNSAVNFDLAFPFITEMAVWMVVAAVSAIVGRYEIELQRHDGRRRLGPYRLDRLLSKGGMGEVYLASHRLLVRPCAVKVIRPDREENEPFRRRFEREVSVLETLNHPNTVRVYDFGHARDGSLYYAMEYLPGMDLNAFVRRYGPLPPNRAIYLLRQVCGALREAHAQKVLHRDITPRNIMVCDRGDGLRDVIKLIDFGLARPLAAEGTRITGTGMVPGTFGFIAPERLAGEQSIGFASDLYSLGCVAYFLLTGRPPFREDEARPASLPATVPSELSAVILRCLRRLPADRYADAASLERELVACHVEPAWTADDAEEWWRRMRPELGPSQPPPHGDGI
jgi:eukaryotic-like serine/threonine-protein kinase